MKTALPVLAVAICCGTPFLLLAGERIAKIRARKGGK